MWEYNYYDPDVLCHYGIKGMRWGVRRVRNNSGVGTKSSSKKPLTDEQKMARKKTAKKVLAASAMALTITAAAALYAKNPAVNKIINSAGQTTLSALKKGKTKAINAGKNYVKDAVKGAKEGVREGIKEAPKKATKTVITGMTMLAAKRALDAAVGKEEAARIFQANNSKKISSFWKVNDKEDKDDD